MADLGVVVAADDVLLRGPAASVLTRSASRPESSADRHCDQHA
jgi:hypothetical protein